ncbi:MAG: DNA-formamidopyrimidine glycosylase [Patescibacteria group bacterium]|nr:DNA-formamidopyrimidine glycosylase [Patescibacteria group bacterium]
MPELPEVESTIQGLRKTIINKIIQDIWTDTRKLVKKPSSFKAFQKEIIGKQIKRIRRRGKNILIDLSGNKTLLIHQKMTGHLLFGKWKFKKGKWISKIKGSLLSDPRNDYLHFIIFFQNEKQLALSDLRKFAKIELWDKLELESSKQFKKLGPEPLGKSFTFKKFKKALSKKKRGKIKQILMDQNIIVGIGNIYSDEILWQVKIHPFQDISGIKEQELKKIYTATKNILKKAVKLKGTSISDFRLVDGSKGYYQSKRKVYRKTGEKCARCKTIIKREKMANRSAHFCPQCQKI